MENNSWKEHVALCPYCELPIGVLCNDGLHAVGGMVLPRVTTMRCWNPYCKKWLTYRPWTGEIALPSLPVMPMQTGALATQ